MQRSIPRTCAAGKMQSVPALSHLSTRRAGRLERALRRKLWNASGARSLDTAEHTSCTQRKLEILRHLDLSHRVALLTPQTTEDATCDPRTCIVARRASKLPLGDMRLTETGMWHFFVRISTGVLPS